jgi:serine/threonine-protein kinase
MWTGRLPFEGATFLAVVSQQMTASPAPPSAHRPVPPALERLILRCLEKDPARRPESARALGAALDAALVDLLPGETLPPGAAAVPTPVPAGPATTLAGEVGPVAPARRPARIAAAVAVALGLLALGGAWLARPAKGPPAAPEAIALPQAPAPAPPPTVAPAPAAAPPAAAAATRVEPALPPSPAPAPAARPARARARDRHAVEPPVQRPASPLDERGFVKENPFR